MTDSAFLPGGWRRGRALGLARVAVLLAGFGIHAARGQTQAAGAAAAQSPGLLLSWNQADHPSGIYHVQDHAMLTVLVENPGREGATLTGEILFGCRVSGAPGTGELKVVSETPIASAEVAAGRRVSIPLQVSFGAAGVYELRWHHGSVTEPIGGAGRSGDLACIFAPRLLPAGHATPDDLPWMTPLPAAAVTHPGFLTDYVAQTAVHRFVIDETFSFDPARNVGLGFGASTGGSQQQIDALLGEAAKAKLGLIVRVTVPLASDSAGAEDKSLQAFRQYITDAIRRGKGSLVALAIMPADAPATPSPPQLREFAAYYRAGAEAARQADKAVLLLGAGSAQKTMEWLANPKLAPWIDGLAICNAAEDAQAVRRFPGPGVVRKSVWLLPPRPGEAWTPPAAGLAAGATQVAVPGPDVDHGVTAHLLSGAVFVQRLAITVPTTDPTAPRSTGIPYVALFQGDGYAVAAVAGFSAGTGLDAEFPGLARTRTEVTPAQDDASSYPNLQVGDDSHSLRVVDADGTPVDCRVGDTLNIPAAENVVYVLAGGAADDLAGVLRVGRINRMPVFEPGLRLSAGVLTVRLHNISTQNLSGSVRLIRATVGQAAEVLAAQDFDAVPAEKTVDLPLAMDPQAAPEVGGPGGVGGAGGGLVVEITTLGSKMLVQRTAVSVEKQ